MISWGRKLNVLVNSGMCDGESSNEECFAFDVMGPGAGVGNGWSVVPCSVGVEDDVDEALLDSVDVDGFECEFEAEYTSEDGVEVPSGAGPSPFDWELSCSPPFELCFDC